MALKDSKRKRRKIPGPEREKKQVENGDEKW